MKTILKTVACLLMALLVSCEKDETEAETKTVPTVETGEITNVGIRSALCGGNVTDDGGAEIVERGICYSTDPNPTLSDKHTVDVIKGSGSFIMDITELDINTQYYVRAYATNAAGTGFGEAVSFSTLNAFPTGGWVYNGHDAVDLGTSVLWATCNVGAKTPDETGYFVAWGETEPRNYYNWSTYKWYDGELIYNPTFKKYNTKSEFGTVDNRKRLEAADDIARKEWGSLWRLPYKEDWQELLDKCKWEVTSYYGMTGFRFIGENGKSIFLRICGYYYLGNILNSLEYGYYWSADLNDDLPSTAWILMMSDFYRVKIHNVSVTDFGRRWGISVRPVHERY